MLDKGDVVLMRNNQFVGKIIIIIIYLHLFYKCHIIITNKVIRYLLRGEQTKVIAKAEAVPL